MPTRKKQEGMGETEKEKQDQKEGSATELSEGKMAESLPKWNQQKS